LSQAKVRSTIQRAWQQLKANSISGTFNDLDGPVAIRRHFDGIVAWTQTRQTTRGYTRFATMRIVLFLIAGKLDFTAINRHPPDPHQIQ
jgi:hypothetical protein